MKRIISIILILTLALPLAPAAFAASDEANEAAQSLYELGLFNGTGTDADGNPIFDLDRAPTRHEAVTMLVRLLGKGEEAENGTWDTPFTDVADWAAPYVGYAYANGLTSGTSETTYSGDETVTASQYITFVLRALGYSSGTDFQWDKAWELSDSLGITSGQYNASTTGFTRGDVAIISNSALDTSYKNSTGALADSLTNTNWLSQENLQGVWQSIGVQTVSGEFDVEFVFSGLEYTQARLYTTDGSATLFEGVYQISEGKLTADCVWTNAIFSLSGEFNTIEVFNGIEVLERHLQYNFTFIDKDTFEYGGNTYYRVSESTITEQVKDRLAQLNDMMNECYDGYDILTFTAVTGVMCSSSYENQYDISSVDGYVAGCEEYLYSIDSSEDFYDYCTYLETQGYEMTDKDTAPYLISSGKYYTERTYEKDDNILKVVYSSFTLGTTKHMHVQIHLGESEMFMFR